MNMRRLENLLAALSVLPTFLLAQGGSIRGRVADAAGAALPRASVSAEGSGLRATTDDQGRYEIRGVSAGTYTVRVRLLGYVQQSARVTVGQGPVTQDFVLAEQAISLSPVDVVVGSRARHTAAEQLAVPVDVFTSEEIAVQGTNETSQILQNLAPSVNFPRQSVTDANDIVRPFTLRGLSPDHTLVLLNGWRRHQMAVLNTFAYGMGAGSSGVDLNALPGGAVDRIEVLRDGASAQYGSDAIAGVVNVVLKEGGFTPFLNVDGGQYRTKGYPHDGTTADLNGGFGVGLGRGSLAVFGEYLHRDPTNRAWPDIFLADQNGVTDVIDTLTGRILKKNNSLTQPNYHWGDGLEKDLMSFANFRMPLNPGGTSEVYAFGGYSHRTGTGNGFFRYFDSNKNWQELYPQGFLPQFRPDVADYSGVESRHAGIVGDVGTELRQEALRIQLLPVLVAVEIAEESVPRAGTVAVAAERVHLTGAAGIERHPEVGERHQVLLEPVAPVVVRLRQRIVFLQDSAGQRVDHIRHAVLVRQEDIGPGAVGRVAMQILPKDRQRAASQTHAESAVEIGGGAVVGVVLRAVLAPIHVQERREPALLQDHVDDARDRVGAVLRRRTVTQHLDPVDGAARQRVEIHATRAGPHPVRERVEHRHLMSAPAIQEHEGVIGTQTAQRERPHDVVGVRNALAREIDRGRQVLENLARLVGSLHRDFFGGEDVDGHRQLLGRGMTRPRPDDDVDR